MEALPKAYVQIPGFGLNVAMVGAAELGPLNPATGLPDILIALDYGDQVVRVTPGALQAALDASCWRGSLRNLAPILPPQPQP